MSSTLNTAMADQPRYSCHGATECKASWTYDDWHCSGCHWKGMGVLDLTHGDKELREKAAALREKLKPPSTAPTKPSAKAVDGTEGPLPANG